MNIRQKLLKKENNKKIFKLFNTNQNDRKKNIFYVNNKKIKSNIFSNSKSCANKTIILVNLNDKNYLNSQNKEFIPRIVINNNNNFVKLKHSHSSGNYINNKLFKNNDSFNNKFLNSKYNFSIIKYPIINEIKKKSERNFFNKRNIFERKGAYESCNELSYNMPTYHKKKIINKKQNNKSVFGSFHIETKSDIFNRILDITKFVNNEINDINKMVKKPY